MDNNGTNINETGGAKEAECVVNGAYSNTVSIDDFVEALEQNVSQVSQLVKEVAVIV